MTLSLCDSPAAGAETYHITLNADRGMSWEAALASREAAEKELTDAGRPLSGAAGFWIDSRVGRNGQGQTGVQPVAFERRPLVPLPCWSPGQVHLDCCSAHMPCPYAKPLWSTAWPCPALDL